MEYEDELERMRNRRRRQKARQQADREPNQVHNGSGKGASGRASGSGAGRSPRVYNDRYYDNSYEYNRHRSRTMDGDPDDEYEAYDSYEDYDDDGGGYHEYEEYEERNSRRLERRSSRPDPRSRKSAANPASDGYGGRGQREGFSRERGRDLRSDPGRDMGGRDRAPRKKKRKPFLFMVLLVILLAGGFFGYRYLWTGTGYWTIAVFGVDSREGRLEQGALSDVEMVCVIDRRMGDIKLVSVFRDTYLEINPDGTYHKINEAYFKGGHQQAVEALERNLDLSIDDYATFNWKAVVDAINILGGIDLEISDSEFKYINSFITETVESTGIGSHHLESPGMNHLDGVQAVAYARLRLMDTDYNRTARQRLVIQLAMNKAKEADLKTVTNLVQAVLPQLSTSIGVDDLLPMARNIRKYHITETGGFPFSRGETHIGKRDCVIPLTLESNVVQLHQLLYGAENFQPSQTVRQISAKIASDSGMGEVAENAPEARVLGQKALEGSGGEVPQNMGGSGSGGQGSGDAGGGSPAENSGSPEGVLPPAKDEPPVQTEASREEALETSQESSEETSMEDGVSEEGNQEESSTDNQLPMPEPSAPETSQASEEGPRHPGETEPEIGPGMTQAAPETPAETKPAETAEVGPGMP